MNYIEQYYSQIESGKTVVSNRVRSVYKSLVSELKEPRDWIFDEEKANKPIEFIEKFCRQSHGEWIRKNIELQLFQKAFISALFGFVNKDGNRRYKETFFLVARKNGRHLPPIAVMQ